MILRSGKKSDKLKYQEESSTFETDDETNSGSDFEEFIDSGELFNHFSLEIIVTIERNQFGRVIFWYLGVFGSSLLVLFMGDSLFLCSFATVSIEFQYTFFAA